MKKSQIVTLIIVLLFLLSACDFRRYDDGDNDNNREDKGPGQVATLLDNRSQQKPLFIPELIDMTQDGSAYELTVDETDHEFLEGHATPVKSYNQQGYLGKTFKLRKGSTFYPTITNNIDEVTTVHWHGLEVSGENDGAAGSIAIVKPGESKTYELAVDQHAATIWYHPHAKGYTASQVYEGLAGMMIIEDEVTDRLELPVDYGVNDIPVILQAKKFDRQGNLSYGHEDALFFEDEGETSSDTTKGFSIVTNGSINPYLEVSRGVIRLRVLNGSNHGLMDISLSDGTPIHVIGTDGGLLESPQQKDMFEIVAGERYEVLIDLSAKGEGEEIDLIANGQHVLNLRITEADGEHQSVPEELVVINALEAYDKQPVTHSFSLNYDLINQTIFDPEVINEEFDRDVIYYFEVTNESYENHSFHIHNAQFLVVEKNGENVDYKEIGWKDTIYLRPEESMVLQIVFRHTGDYMYHCHILIHEENGMMGKFRVK